MIISEYSKKISLSLRVFLSFVLTFLLVLPVSAAPSDSTLNFFNENEIRYYNPTGSDSCTIGTGSYDGSTSAGLSETQAAFVDTYHDIAQQLSVEYGIPWETVVAQGILESAAGTSSFAVNRNNFFGIGAFDSNPNNAFSYATPEEGWRGYYENIRKTSTYRNHGVFQEPNITNPYAYTEAIKAAGYATDPNYVSKVHSLIAAIETRSKEKGWLSSAELATKYPGMLTNAAKYAVNAGDAPSTDTSYVSGACISAGGNGDINQTALDLAWPDRSHSYDDPRPTYAAALEATGFSSYPSSSDPDVPRGSSCDVFVATVMHYSGVDPNFPRFLQSSNPNGQEGYMKSHPELYQYVGVADNSAIAQPGDIRISNGHVTIVVRKEDGSIGIADASHTGYDKQGNITSVPRTAGVGNWYNDGNFRLYRHI